MRDKHVLLRIHPPKKENSGNRPMPVVHWDLLMWSLDVHPDKKDQPQHQQEIGLEWEVGLCWRCL
jgi:hypothetical protein